MWVTSRLITIKIILKKKGLNILSPRLSGGAVSLYRPREVYNPTDSPFTFVNFIESRLSVTWMLPASRVTSGGYWYLFCVVCSVGDAVWRNGQSSNRSALGFCWILLHRYLVNLNSFMLYLHLRTLTGFFIMSLGHCLIGLSFIVRQVPLTAVKTSWWRLTTQG